MDLELDLNAVKTFFDPHPGLAGALIPLPIAVKNVADKLNGQSMPLREAVAKIQSVTNGTVSIIKDGWIALELHEYDARHMFRVIRFG